MAVGRDALPMPLDHLGKFLVGLEPLPLERRLPVVEEPTRPAFRLVTPQLTKGLLQKIGRIQPLVGPKKLPERLTSRKIQVLLARKQRVLLTLDKRSIPARKPPVFLLPDRIHRLAQMPHHMELVVKDGGLRDILLCRLLESLPHVHDRQSDLLGLLGPQRFVKQVHTLFRSVRSTKPDRPPSDEIADNDPVGMPLSDRDLVDADDLRRRCPRPPELLSHVLLLQLLDRVPVETSLLRHILNRHRPAPSPYKERESLRVKRIVGEPIEFLLPHLPAPQAEDASNLQFQIDPRIPARQVSNTPGLPVVEAPMSSPTRTAPRFF